jgi:tellurite resistance protein TerC
MLATLADLLQQLRDAAPAIALLVLTEGLLSVDNILSVAALASRLPETERRKALQLGLLGAYVFRALALLLAAWIVRSHVMLLLGAVYLIHLATVHFGEHDAETNTSPRAQRNFWRTVIAIQFLDLSLSLDNVVVAIGIAPDQMWIIYAGVFLGLLTLWLFASASLRLIERHPILKHAAFLLVGLVGLTLLLEVTWHVNVTRWEKFAGSAIVIAACLAYARFEKVRKICRPVFAILVKPLRLYNRSIDAVLRLLRSSPKQTTPDQR